MKETEQKLNPIQIDGCNSADAESYRQLFDQTVIIHGNQRCR